MSSHINSSTRIKDDDGPRDLPKPTAASAENPIPDQKPEKPAKLLNALNRVSSIKACEACRKRKTKCSGAENPPCQTCRLRGTECIFEKPTLETQNNPKQRIQHPLVLSRRTRSTLRSYNSSVTASLSGSQPPAFIDLAPSPQSSTSHPSPASAREMYELTRSKPLSTSSPLSQGSGGTSSHVEGFNPPTRPPPAANPQLWSWFRSVGEDHRSEITADELQRALCNGSWTRDLGDGSWTPLDLDTVYMLMDLIGLPLAAS